MVGGRWPWSTMLLRLTTTTTTTNTTAAATTLLRPRYYYYYHPTTLLPYYPTTNTTYLSIAPYSTLPYPTLPYASYTTRLSSLPPSPSNMLPHFLLTGLLAVAVNAMPNIPSHSLSVYRTVDHITKYKPSTLCTGRALPTKSRTKVKTVTSTITTCSAPTTVTTTVTPDAVTVTTYDNATQLAIRARQDAGCTSTTTVYVSRLFCHHTSPSPALQS